jgi:hypothetical protein
MQLTEDQNRRMLAILVEIAEMDAVRDEDGFSGWWTICSFCHAMYRPNKDFSHADDCVWVRARELRAEIGGE